MSPPNEQDGQTFAQQILDELAHTAYACSDLTKLSGGTANFLYRGTLLKPIEGDADDIRAAQTVVIKHSTDYVAVNRNFPLDVTRCIFEESMLHALDGVSHTIITHSGPAVATTPRLYMFDRATYTQVHEDFLGATDLTTVLLSANVDQRLPESSRQSIGYAMGSWLRFFHKWASGPAQATLREIVGPNKGMRQLKCLITYDSFIEILERHPETIKGHRETLEAVRTTMKHEFEQPPTEGDEIRGLIHGDFWAGNVLLPGSSWQEAQQSTQDPHKLFIIDWENAQFGHRAVDIGGMLADLYERKHFRNVDGSIPIMQGFIEGYGPLSEELAFSAAIHAGVHLICWYYRRNRNDPLPFPLPKVLAALTLGRDFILKGWAKDKKWFEGSVLAPLFSENQQSR